MKVYRIEVRPRGTVSHHALVTAAHQLGHPSLAACQVTRLFFIRGDLTDDAVTRLAETLLADPVTETYTLGETPTPSGAHRVERTLLPGVTDPAAESLTHAAHLIGIDLAQAATGERYDLIGDLSPEAVNRIAAGVLSNAVIHRVSVNESISAPFIAPAPPDLTVEIIPVLGLDDAALLALSAERRLSLDLNEMRAIRAYFETEKRDPTDAELEMLAQTWSEHCVHKTFRAKITYTGPAHGAAAESESVTQEIDGLLKTYLRSVTDKLAKPWVRSAFVDNAGVIAFDDQYDLAFKVETHNRPSALEPFGGANTGAGGVIRDVLGVSARPIANTDILCFGMPDTPADSLPENVLHPRLIIDGVVHGIEDYGNKMGIPTVNGAVQYHPGYTANPLVFAGCVGIAPVGSHRAEARHGDLIVVMGGRTGRDGLRGATFSSMEMDTTTAKVSGGAVQIGHPINEKQVMEAVLRARDAELYTAITDCGAGGLSSAVGEMGQALGAKVQLADVPLKYPGLRPWEIWLSEAQERMVMAVPPANWDALKAICDAHDVEVLSIGTYESTGHLELFYGAERVGDVSMDLLHHGIPRRELKAVWGKPLTPNPSPTEGRGASFGAIMSSSSDPIKSHTSGAIKFPSPLVGEGKLLLAMLSNPSVRSKSDVIHRYDHEVGTGTAVKPLVGRGAGPGDAAVIVPQDTLRPLTPKSPLPQGARGLEASKHISDEEDFDKIVVPPMLLEVMTAIARRLRHEQTQSEIILWEALRGRKLDGRKFRRQQPVGAFVLDFYCAEERLAVEVDGAIHDTQVEADAERQAILESLGIRFIRVSAELVEQDLPLTLNRIKSAFTPPSPLVGEGGRGVRGFSLSVGMCPQYTAHDPYAMAWAAIDESVRNAVAVGADPDQLAILDNFSWGNTNLPDRMGELVRCLQGCYDAALAYGTPYISGKDSLNNEYLDENGVRRAIPGTLVISTIGIVPDVAHVVTSDFKADGSHIYLIGQTRSDEIAGSLYAELTGAAGGIVPQPVDNALETYRAVHQAIKAGWVLSAHDASEGGLAVALAEMCIGGRLGATLTTAHDAASLFSESQGRLILEIASENAAAFESIMSAANAPFSVIGVVGGESLTIGAATDTDARTGYILSLPVAALAEAWGAPAFYPVRTPYGASATVKPAAPLLKKSPRVLIMHAPGSNRDRDAVIACEMAGGEPEIVTVNQLVRGERSLLDYHMLVIPGGFSYGDDLGAGALWALNLRERIPGVTEFVQGGRPVLGICNGFQTLVKSGLLPGDSWDGGARKVTLTYNAQARFECRWVLLETNPASPCLFTDGIDDPIYCPIAHGEGRVQVADEATRLRIITDGLAAIRYITPDDLPAHEFPFNPNGSIDAIAGLCNPAGNVFGLMPHPENHIFPWQHPQHTAGQRGLDGLRLFQNGLKHA